MAPHHGPTTPPCRPTVDDPFLTPQNHHLLAKTSPRECPMDPQNHIFQRQITRSPCLRDSFGCSGGLVQEPSILLQIPIFLRLNRCPRRCPHNILYRLKIRC